MSSRRIRFLTATLLACAVVGCGQSPSAKSESEKSVEKTPAGKTQPSTPRKTPNEVTAADAVRAVAAGFRDKKAEALWDFLPPRYQRDVNAVVHEFAASMDAELWDATFAFASRVVKILKNRKAEILSAPVWSRVKGIDAKSLERDWDGTIALVEIVADSELAHLDAMKTMDAGKFLASTGSGFLRNLAEFSKFMPEDVMKSELNQWGGLRVERLSGDEKTAVLALSFRDDPDTVQKTPFVKVDGKWVPQSMAEVWDARIAEIRADLKQKLAPEKLAARKKIVLKYFADLDGPLSELENAKSTTDFQQKLAQSPVMSVLLIVFRDGGSSDANTAGPVIPSAGKKLAKPGPTANVLVIVQGAIDRKTADTIADELFNLGDAYDVGDVSERDGNTVFPVSEVADFEAFRKKIKFADVVSANAKKREIVLRLQKK